MSGTVSVPREGCRSRTWQDGVAAAGNPSKRPQGGGRRSFTLKCLPRSVSWALWLNPCRDSRIAASLARGGAKARARASDRVFADALPWACRWGPLQSEQLDSLYACAGYGLLQAWRWREHGLVQRLKASAEARQCERSRPACTRRSDGTTIVAGASWSLLCPC